MSYDRRTAGVTEAPEGAAISYHGKPLKYEGGAQWVLEGRGARAIVGYNMHPLRQTWSGRLVIETAEGLRSLKLGPGKSIEEILDAGIESERVRLEQGRKQLEQELSALSSLK